MSLFEIFRGLLGPSWRLEGHGGGDRGGGERSHRGLWLDQDDEDEDEEGEERFGSWGDPFGPAPHGQPFGREFAGLFREMDELFRGIGSWDMPIGQFEFPEPGGGSSVPGRGGQEEEDGAGKGGSARDWMLRRPHGDVDGDGETSRSGPRSGERPGNWAPRPHTRPWKPSSNFEDIWNTLQKEDATKQDQDLDSKVTSEGLERALKPAQPTVKSYFRSVSISKILHPDGTVEERRTERDGQGNEETKTTRVQGDQSFTTVTRRGTDGSEDSSRQLSDQDRALQRFAELRDRGEGSGVPGESPTLRNSTSLLDRLLEGLFRSR